MMDINDKVGLTGWHDECGGVNAKVSKSNISARL